MADHNEGDDYMEKAFSEAKKSKDPKTKVGACIVNEENVIVGTGYNHMPLGHDDYYSWEGRNHGPNLSDEDKLKNKHLYVCHAEVNAILNAVQDLHGCTLYATLFPCNECAKMIIQKGIKKVIYASDKHAHKIETKAAKKMFDQENITYQNYVADM